MRKQQAFFIESIRKAPDRNKMVMLQRALQISTPLKSHHVYLYNIYKAAIKYVLVFTRILPQRTRTDEMNERRVLRERKQTLSAPPITLSSK